MKSVFTLSVSAARSVLSGIVWYAKQSKQKYYYKDILIIYVYTRVRNNREYINI